MTMRDHCPSGRSTAYAVTRVCALESLISLAARKRRCSPSPGSAHSCVSICVAKNCDVRCLISQLWSVVNMWYVPKLFHLQLERQERFRPATALQIRRLQHRRPEHLSLC